MSTRHLNWTVSQLITLGLGTHKLATVPPHSVRKLHLVIAVLAIGTAARPAQAEFWFEDLTDGNISDSGIDWSLLSRATISSDGLELNSNNGAGDIASAKLPIIGQGWAVRTKGRLLRDLGVLGVGAGGFWSALTVDGSAALGERGAGSDRLY